MSLKSLKSNLGTPKGTEILNGLKLDLAKKGALTPQNTPDDEYARSILTVACYHSLKASDLPGFERHFTQLLPFSPNAEFCGLWLMYLLACARMAEYHTFLETLDDDTRASSFVTFAEDIQVALMEGAYGAVLAHKKVPNEWYGVFVAILTETVREEMARGLPLAYPCLGVDACSDLLRFETTDALEGFVEKQGWRIEDGKVFFSGQGETGGQGEPLVDAFPIIGHLLHVTSELEKIV